MASKQDEVVGVKESRVKKLESELHHCADQLKAKEKEFQNLRKELSSLRTKLDESQVQAKTNENVISYLNKQVSELQVRHGIKTGGGDTKTQTKSCTTAKNNLLDKQKSKTDPKIIAQRNALFVGGGPRIPDHFKR